MVPTSDQDLVPPNRAVRTSGSLPGPFPIQIRCLRQTICSLHLLFVDLGNDTPDICIKPVCVVILVQVTANQSTGCMNMKVLLRNRETGQYYAGPEGWRNEISLAIDFRTVEIASIWASLSQLRGMEVVLHEDDTSADLLMPLQMVG